MPPLIMLIRHAEKPVPGRAPFGVSVDGAPDPESLTPRGWQRAGALVGMFVGSATEGRPSRLPTPTHLFASRIGPGSSSRRPFETLQPLSERLGLTIDSRFLKEELGQLAEGARGIDGVGLISWEHHLMPALANMLVGDTTSAPQIWPDDRFDIVWLIDLRAPAGRTRFRQVPELLLGGDQAGVIPA